MSFQCFSYIGSNKLFNVTSIICDIFEIFHRFISRSKFSCNLSNFFPHLCTIELSPMLRYRSFGVVLLRFVCHTFHVVEELEDKFFFNGHTVNICHRLAVLVDASYATAIAQYLYGQYNILFLWLMLDIHNSNAFCAVGRYHAEAIRFSQIPWIDRYQHLSVGSSPLGP